MLYIGIDLGTSAVKLLAMDEAGRIVKVVSRDYPICFPKPGWSEQNPEDWYERTMDGLKELLSECDKSLVRGISFAGQMHGLVVLDHKDQVIRPAILWNDGRTEKQTDFLNREIGKENIQKYTSNIAFAGFTAPKLLWMKENEPENFHNISKLMLPKDYLAYRMTGVFCTDYSDASGTLLLDVAHRCWSKEMLKICDVEPCQLPQLHESFDVVGTLKKEITDALGLSDAVKVIAGAGDNAAAAIATGTVGEEKCNISLGTSGTIFVSGKRCGELKHQALHSFAHADGGYHLMGCILSAASCNGWWMNSILNTDQYEREQMNIEGLGENHVFFLPYLMGERSPHNDPNARAMFFGMSLDTTRAEMTQAVLEGVGFALRDSLEIVKGLGIAPERTGLCGGGAKSPIWRKIIADILNMKVDLIESEEGPGFGAAILAAVGCGEFSSVDEAAQALVKVVETIDPDPETASKYDQKYRRFHSIYPAVAKLFEGSILM